MTGCITAEEMKYVGSLSCWIMFILYSRFVLMHLPGKITYKEIDEMIKGRIYYICQDKSLDKVHRE